MVDLDALESWAASDLAPFHRAVVAEAVGELRRLRALLEGLAYDDGDLRMTGEYVARRFQELRAERDRLGAVAAAAEAEAAAMRGIVAGWEDYFDNGPHMSHTGPKRDGRGQADFGIKLREMAAAALSAPGPGAALLARVAAVEARLARLEEAARPFAVVASGALENLPEECPDACEMELWPITVGDCRRLRDALAGEGAP